jgi:formylglycine-generating enzyme required for sulfatase activity
MANTLESNYRHLVLDLADYLSFNCEVITVDPYGQVTKQEHLSISYQQIDLGQGVTLDMVLIPGGIFLRGSPGQELGRAMEEGPQREVIIPVFWIGKYPITQAQWKAVSAMGKIAQDLNPNPSYQQGDHLPVENISWYDAMEFCARLSAHTDQEYTLPSEAQWEYACRAGTITPFHFGETITTDLANYAGTEHQSKQGRSSSGFYGSGPKGTYRQKTTDIGSFPPNAFGLYDMHGNVWEWCLDHWHDNYRNAPGDGTAWISSDLSADRVLRGGSWVDGPAYCRAAFRFHHQPDYRLGLNGFRVVRLPPKPIVHADMVRLIKNHESSDKKEAEQKVWVPPQSLVNAEPTYPHFSFEVVTVNHRGQIVDRQQSSAPYQTLDLGQGVTLDMVLIPGGSFLMGSPNSEPDRDRREGPQHQVTLAGFWMGKYPVTQAQYQAIMGNNPAKFKGDNRPVEQVSWNDAIEFCDRLSQKLGQPYNLPSEAQWEYACRAGTTTPFHFGETLTTDLANYNGNDTYGAGPKGIYRDETSEVGSFPPNGFGLYDMHGNVWEWCLDRWHNSYQGAPADGSAWISDENKLLGLFSNIVCRGGSWDSFPRSCRCAYGFFSTPAFCNFYDGFRVVSVPPRALG